MDDITEGINEGWKLSVGFEDGAIVGAELGSLEE